MSSLIAGLSSSARKVKVDLWVSWRIAWTVGQGLVECYDELPTTREAVSCSADVSECCLASRYFCEPSETHLFLSLSKLFLIK